MDRVQRKLNICAGIAKSRIPGLSPDYVNQIYKPHFSPYLGLRASTFLIAFEYLQKQRKNPSRLIVETGTATRGLNQWEGYGAATVLFDTFVNCEGGRVISIDIDPEAVECSRKYVSTKTRVIQGDSLSELKKIEDPVDCLYLDSYDLEWFSPDNSAEHTLKEFMLIESRLNKGALIMIDDSPREIALLPPWFDDYVQEFHKTRAEVPWPNGKGKKLIPYLEKSAKYQKIFH